MPKLISSSMFYLIAAAVAAIAIFSYFSDAGDQNDRPPSHASYESPQPPVLPRRDERQKRRTIEPPSPRHGVPVVPVKEDPTSLRARARQEAELMTQCFQQSKEAYDRRDHAGAKALSAEGKHHEQMMKNLDERASAAVYRENNQDKVEGEADLHGLYVKEAIAYSEQAIREARRRGDSEIRLIVGKGNHSDGGISKLKPAIEKEMRTRGFPVDVDPKNPGVLLVRVGGK